MRSCRPAWSKTRVLSAISRDLRQAAAEIGEQHGGVAIEAAGKGERGADRLVDKARVSRAFVKGVVKKLSFTRS
jgi:hypothetical protein